MTARSEQETTITYLRDDDAVSVYTSSLPVLRRFRKLSSTQEFVREVRGGTDWAEFTIAAENFRLFTAVRAKRKISAAERARRSERMRRMRNEVSA
ncbi:hypothetical protein [Microbacterium invictum]|uniref:Uncharacterized protein n=1 Tax=Microbacterium invictum TaxID=515415 RepID=A0ABZ0V609_9MICO|nr:hypothetical protein [Microbacterium invictum]WQB69023.1 hypothetical protein T9R20_09895 [Microbacterium invictum]